MTVRCAECQGEITQLAQATLLPETTESGRRVLVMYCKPCAKKKESVDPS